MILWWRNGGGIWNWKVWRKKWLSGLSLCKILKWKSGGENDGDEPMCFIFFFPIYKKIIPPTPTGGFILKNIHPCIILCEVTSYVIYMHLCTHIYTIQGCTVWYFRWTKKGESALIVYIYSRYTARCFLWIGKGWECTVGKHRRN